jgi:hypothetical protein
VSLVAAYDPHWQARTAVTDAQGRFRFRGLQQIAYAIRISTPAAGIVEVQGGESVAPGTTDARLVAIAGGTLSGVVVDEQNHALRDAMVTVSAGDKTQSARTSRDGTFEVRDLRREPCTVHVDVVGYVPQSLGGVTPGGAPVRIALAGGLEVFGRLIKSDGTPQRARLDFRHPESDLLSRQTWTDESGCFRLSGFVDARYEVIAVAGSALIVDVGGVTPGTGTEIELRLP